MPETPHPGPVRRRRWKRLRVAVILLGLAIAALPRLARIALNQYGWRELQKRSAPVRMEGRLDALTWHSAVATGVRLQLHDTLDLRLPALRAQYRPWQLARRRLDHVDLTGIALLGPPPVRSFPFELSLSDFTWQPDGPHGAMRADLQSPWGEIALAAWSPPSAPDQALHWSVEATDPAPWLQALTGLAFSPSEPPSLGAQLHATPGGPLLLASADLPIATHPAFQLRGGSARITAHWPLQPDDGGMLRFEQLSLGVLQAGPAAWPLHLTATHATLRGSLPIAGSSAVAMLALDVPFDPASARVVSFELPLGQADAPLLLSALDPALPPLQLTGHLAGRLTSGATVRDALRVELAVAQLVHPDWGLAVSNLNAACVFPLKGLPRSDPAQEARIDSLRLGNLRFDDIRAIYQIEPPQTLFLEDLEARWCGGHVALHTLRLAPSLRDLTVRLDCRLLELEPLLTQLGALDVTGSGQFSGSAELHVTGRHVQIRHGFLYTTPGVPGRLTVRNPAQLAAALPGSTVQGAQVAMVAAALKNFLYDWITLTLQQQGELLQVRTSLFGKPATTIPFAYDAERGVYVPVSKGGTDRAMRLDLNFTVPLNQLLDYAYGVSGKVKLKGRP